MSKHETKRRPKTPKLIILEINYNSRLIFYNYPDLTLLQELLIILLYNSIQEYKTKESKGNVFPILP